MVLRQVMIFMLMSCYIGAIAQSEGQDADEQAPTDEYYEESYVEGDDFSRMHFLELNLHLTDPTGALDRNINSKYFGFGLDYLFQLSSDRPGFVGIGFDYTFLENAGLTTFDPTDGFPFDFSSSTSLGTLSAMYRHYIGLNLLGLEPFVEGSLGIAAMWSSTSVTSSDDPDFSEFDFNNFDPSLAYAFRGGVHYSVADAIYVTAKVGYMSTLSTEYDVRDDNSTAINSSYDYFSRKSSTVDVIRYDLGVTFAF